MSEQRFEFGKNWQSFLAALDEDRVDAAMRSLVHLLKTDSLVDQRFLDLGCGSGLFSLAAHRLGAEVISIDFDPDSVACTQQLRDRFANSTPAWLIHQGSALDESLIQSLVNTHGMADVVYSWGVLHHTGNLERAIEISSRAVGPSGLFCIAIYNDQGSASRRWLAIKQIYNRLPRCLRPVWVIAIAGIYESKFALSRLLRLQNPLPFADWRAKRAGRGMSAWHDWVDWIGGLPFEVASPARIESMMVQHGFALVEANLIGSGWGCNEFVFRRLN